MIPSELPMLSSLAQSRADTNGHSSHPLSSPFSGSDPNNVFQAAAASTGLFGQLGQFSPDQMQMLQSLQQIGQQKQKEVSEEIWHQHDTEYYTSLLWCRPSQDPPVFVLQRKRLAAKTRITLEF